MYWNLENSKKEMEIRKRIERHERLLEKARQDLVKLYDKVSKENNVHENMDVA